MNKNIQWWSLVFFHNVIVHPMLPLAEILFTINTPLTNSIATIIFNLHDISYPEDITSIENEE